MAGALALLGGCENTPSINVWGAYYPDWLFCWLAGVFLMCVAHALIKLLKADSFIPSVALTYTLLTASFSLGVWLVFFPA